MKRVMGVIGCVMFCLVAALVCYSLRKEDIPIEYESSAKYATTVAGERDFGIAITTSGTPYVWLSETYVADGISRMIVGKPQKISEIDNAVSVSAERGIAVITTADGKIFQLVFYGDHMGQYTLREISNVDSASKAEAPAIRSSYYDDYCYAILYDGAIIRWNPYDEDIFVEKIYPAGDNVLLNGCVINKDGEITDLASGYMVHPNFEVKMIYDLFDSIVLLAEDGWMYEVDYMNQSINRITNIYGFKLFNYERNIRYDGIVINDSGEQLYDLEHVIYIDNKTMITAEGRIYQAQDSYKSYDDHDGSFCFERNYVEIQLPEEVAVQNIIDDYSYNVVLTRSEGIENDVANYLIIGQ